MNCHICSLLVLCALLRRNRRSSSTFTFKGAFIFATVIFFLLVRLSTGHTKIIVVNERVAFKSFAKFL